MNNLRVVFKRFAAVSSLVFVFSSLVSLTACGDDGSSGSDSGNGDGAVYASVDDLPECTAGNAESLADVDGDYYTCVSKNWEKVLDVAKGVCNIRPCDKSTEGKWVYVYADSSAYQCKSGTWKDSYGKTFSELDFVGCFMNALVKDTVASADDLKNCTENKEGNIFVVGKSMVACYAKSWVGIPGGVVSEGDLPDCSANGYIYVMGKMAVYQCKDGVWYGNGKAVKQASADVPKSSSSKAVEPEPTSSQSGSDKPSSSSKEVVDDGTKVRGVCKASTVETTKGKAVTYSFYNMGGTLVSYSWTFGEGASVATSDEAEPSVSYSQGGVHKAKLVMNKGRESESDEIVCPGVTVEATPVTGCVCTTETSSLILKGGNPAEAQWSVSGCRSDSPVTYEWGGGASGTSASATGQTNSLGKYAPTVTVINDDGGIMEPECKAIPVMEPLSAKCSFVGNHFQISDMTGISDEQSSIDVTLVSATGVSIEKTLTGSLTSKCTTVPGYGYKCGDAYDWSWLHESIDVDADLGYARFALVHDGDTLCTATAVSCGPSTSVAHKGETISWNMQSISWPVPSPKTVSRVIIDEDGNEHSGPTITATKYGVIKATMILDEGLETENVLACPDVSVEPREITDCTCTSELLSESNDLADVDEVSYRWKVTGCTSEDAEPLTYSWEDGYAVDAADQTIVTRTFTEMGSYRPVVTVENQEGEVQDFACKAGIVKGGTASELVYGDQTYRTELIGSQVWMAENLNYEVSGSVCFDNKADNCAKYGRLYSADQAQDVCPEGWHLPSQGEFEELLETVGGSFENLKAEEWGGEDAYGFSALPAGKNDVIAGTFTTSQYITGWWLQSAKGKTYSNLYGIRSSAMYTGFDTDDSVNGFSVRCVKD